MLKIRRFFQRRLFPVIFFTAGAPLFAEDAGIADTLFHHVLNGEELELFPFLPPIKLPFELTVHHFMVLLAVVLILAVFIIAAKKSSRRPGKMMVGIESVILFIRNDIVYPVMGEEKGRKWISFFVTLFVFLFTVNVLGLIPAFKTATGNVNVTSALAIIVFLLTFIVGFKEIGVGRFFKNLFPEGAPLPIGIFVVLLEFISIFTRSIVLSLRLFANMFAGHLAILSFLVLIFVISPVFSFVAVPFAVFTYVLEVLIAFLQAFVFTLLSCIFISMASSH